MATEAGELIVKISADVADIKAALAKTKDDVNGLSAATVAAGAAMAAAFVAMATKTIEFSYESVKAYAEHEQALTRLTILVGRDAARAMDEYASSLQRTTTFSDDEILSLEKQLSQYGIYPGSVRTATKALLDFASVTGTDLPSAGAMLAKAMSGQSRELKQYGLDLSVTATRSQNLEKTTQFLQERFGSAAETMKGTTIGAVQSLNNRFEDLKKRLGEDLMPVANKFLEWADSAVTSIETLMNHNKKWGDSIDEQKGKLAQMVAEGKAQISNGVQLDEQQKKAIQTQADYVKQLIRTRVAKDDAKGATDREISSIRTLKDEIQKLQQEQTHLDEITRLSIQKRILGDQMLVAQLKADHEYVTQITNIETEKRLATSKMAWERNASLSAQLRVKLSDDIGQIRAEFVNMAVTAMNQFGQGVADMILQGARFRDVMKKIWQDMARAFIAAVTSMIAKWLAFKALTAAFGGGFGGIIGGMAEGGMINEPSVITGLRTGQQHFAGEVGPEMVVPMSGSASASGGNKAFEGGGGGGGGQGAMVVNINGQFIEGSPAKWQSLVRGVIVKELRRWSMRSPTGPFQRRRGASI